MLDLSKIRAITLDLDDTLWPILPVILRAEAAMSDWLVSKAPKTAHIFTQPERRLALRQQVQRSRPDIGHDLSTLRREIIRLALHSSGEDVSLVEGAYEVFFEHRMRVDLYPDARLGLQRLARRFPLVALSNGNADLTRVGIAEFFHAGLSAQAFGVGKPDPRIFHAAALAAGVASHEVLHVGDDAALDVLGGLGAGMQTAWINRHAHSWVHGNEPHATVSNLEQLCDLLEPSKQSS
jgi:FMN hydrolase / 5-amino-6-(5-phospho-D-ribitylamino)uracil phosphatase